MRPLAGVKHLALEEVEPVEMRPVGRREAADRHDAEPGRAALVGVRLDIPAFPGFVEGERRHPGAEADVAPEVEPVRHMVGIGQDFRLRGVFLGPLPLLVQFLGEGIGILQALDIAARAGIAVPVPGAAYIAAGLEDPRREAELAQAVQHVHAGKARPDDHGVEVGLRRGCSHGRDPFGCPEEGILSIANRAADAATGGPDLHRSGLSAGRCVRPLATLRWNK